MLKKVALLSSMLVTLSQSAAFGQAHVNPEYTKFKTHDRDEITLDNGKRVAYTVVSRAVKGKFEIISAKLNDAKLADLANHQNLMVTLDNDKKQLHGFVETSDGHFQLGADTNSVWKKVNTPKVLDSILKPKSGGPQRSAKQIAAAAEGEKDANGNYVIDVFMGFSDQAAAKAGNIEAYAQMQVATVNTALKNSNIQGVYLRLVGVGQVPNNPGIVTSVLDDVKVWFKNDIERLAPDLIAMQQMPTGAPNEAAGWAGVGGAADTQVVGVPWPNAWRHEVGHNVGGWHCKEAGDTGYNYGYKVREGRATAMCGNDLGYYSSPLVKDSEGNVLGTAASQDMARVWRERMAEMASRRIHKVPYTGDTSLPITLQAEDYINAYDTTNGNQGGAYRAGNVDIEATKDVGGGFNVGWIDAGEWLSYKITVPADGLYEVSYRVASPGGGGIIQFEKQGGAVAYGTVNVPNTGGWQNWATVKHTVALKAGSQNIALAIKAGGFNLNWLHIEKVAIGAGNYRIQNLWIPEQSLNIEHGALESSNVAATLATDQWLFERVGDSNFYRIKNRAKPGVALNIEAGTLVASPVGDGWFSAHWELEAVDGSSNQFRLKNRWKPDQFIHIEGNRLQTGPAQPGWWSAIWNMVEVK